MSRRRDRVIHALYFSVFADDYCLASAWLEAKGKSHFAFWIRQKMIGEAVFLFKSRQFFRRVSGCAQQDVTFPGELWGFITEAAGFLRSPRRVGFWKEEENDTLLIFK